MEVWVSAKPYMLYEAVELLYAYVNEIPAGSLTQEGEYCLTEEAVQQMMDVACAGVSRDDPAVRYYFGRHIISEEPQRATCMARNLAYNTMTPSKGNMDEDCAEICALRRVQRKNGQRPSAINEYRIFYTGATGNAFLPIAQDIARLGVDEEYSQMLLEQFSGFDDAVEQLKAIIAPVAAELEPLLLPWAQLAEPLARILEAHYYQPDAVEKWCNRVRYREDKPREAMRVQLRYLRPKLALGMVLEYKAFCHIGVAVPVVKPETETFQQWEYQALRLLGSEARMRMLWAMLDKPMSARELSQQLDMHLGVVCRDLGNLFNSRLLLAESVKGRNRYRTNRESLDTLARHLMEMEKFKPSETGGAEA